MPDVSPLIAFVAGFLSFLSPCVLPLVPGYISLMSGARIDTLKEGEGGATRAVALHALFFIAGFSLVFIAMGASASAVGGFQGPPRSSPGAEGAFQIVWKLTPGNSLQPLRVKTGLTDFTFTALLEGELKPGDKVVIGQTLGRGQRPGQPFRGPRPPQRF